MLHVYCLFNQAKCNCRPSNSPDYADAIDLSLHNQWERTYNLERTTLS
jgi:hypothetical protein